MINTEIQIKSNKLSFILYIFFVIVQMQNEGSNGVRSCEQDLGKQGNNQEGLSVVGSGALALDRRLATQFLLSPEMSVSSFHTKSFKLFSILIIPEYRSGDHF